jgi:hypothetical protein
VASTQMNQTLPAIGRPHYKYRVRFQDQDLHHYMWLTESVLRQ